MHIGLEKLPSLTLGTHGQLYRLVVCVCVCVCVCVWVTASTDSPPWLLHLKSNITYSTVQCSNSKVHIQMLRPLFAAFFVWCAFLFVGQHFTSIGVENTVPGNKGQNGFVLLQNNNNNNNNTF